MLYTLDEAYALRPGGILVEGNLQTIESRPEHMQLPLAIFPNSCLSVIKVQVSSPAAHVVANSLTSVQFKPYFTMWTSLFIVSILMCPRKVLVKQRV
jgi:hypothetical protein